jgi:hypothetical protein
MSNIINWFGGMWGFVDGIITLATLGFVFWNFYKGKKNDEKIEVSFDIDGKKERLTTYILRKYITRAEVSGVLRSKLKKEISEFNIKYLSTSKYAEDIFKIQKGKKDTLIIHITQEERNCFNNNL